MVAIVGLLLAPARLSYCQFREAPGYVGDEACRPCHQQVFATYVTSAHHLASQLPSQTSIAGKFTAGSNILRTSNPYFYFVMEATSEGYFQNAIAWFPPSQTISRRERFDLVIGSGRKGQTYLYWKGNQLFELPVSYWTETQAWMNSPGYPDGLPNFDKPIISRCLECHSTHFESLPPAPDRFSRTSMVLGITCEKCHGAGRAHIDNHQPGRREPKGTADILNPASLSRERQIDVCALCHAGPGTPKGPAFSFIPGADLGNYLTIPKDADDTPVDVHGHQVQLLESSRCFRLSGMTCTTCHDVHTQQRDPAYFSQRCLTCHRMESCGKYLTMGRQILSHCVDCHMPLRESNVIVFDASGHPVKPQVRSHRIAIY